MTNKNELKKINTKYRTYHYFDGIINTKYVYPKNLNADESYSNLLHWICNFKLCKTFYVTFNKTKGYIEDNNWRKYLALTRIDKNKNTIERYEQTWNQATYQVKR